MSNNIHNSKVSEKAVWDGSIPPDDGASLNTSQLQAQPQMMFCYKCNNVIPNNSTYCPYCQVKLYTECPKCGVKYSSQYPACNQCGTNRLEYIETQRREKERIEAKKLEERLRQEKLEQEQQEREAHWRRKKEQIINTKEYQSIYSILEESLDSLDRKFILSFVLAFALLFIWVIVYIWVYEEGLFKVSSEEFLVILLWSAGGLFLCSVLLGYGYLTDPQKREQYILQYLKKYNCDYNKDMLNYVLNEMRDSTNRVTLGKLSEWCIEAYIKQAEVSSL